MMKTSSLERGQAILIGTILFMVVSLIIVMGFVVPITHENRAVNDLFLSRGSYFLAESGAEDAIYRLQNRMSVAANNQSLYLGGYDATTTTTDLGSAAKVVDTTATWDGRVRKVEVTLGQGIGVSFSYGIQTGQGGFILDNNSGIQGNVYSDGSINGSNGAYITGSAFAADSITLTADQSNLTPTPPTSSITFRNTSATRDLAQSFQTATTEKINKIQLYIQKVGTPADAAVKIVSDSSNAPGGTVLASGTLASGQVGTSYALIDVVLTSNPVLAAGTRYWIILQNGTQSASNYYMIGANAAYASGDARTGTFGGTWTATSKDAYFAVFLGGVNSTINNVVVGTGGVGDAWAHSVTNSSVAGNLWCQIGSGNSKACNTSKSDPVPQGLPISQANINQWEADATAGGVTNNDVSYSGTTGSLGPRKIVGNLSIQGGATLNLTGVLWVTGNITVANNAGIVVDPSFGGGSGVIVTDGRISIFNNGTFAGSGDPNSYLLAVTTSNCPASVSCSGSPAVSVSNNAGAIILNAQNGEIDFLNGAGANEATANLIHLSNGAVIQYKVGLASQDFVSGPSGGWQVKSWQEVQ